MQLRYYSLSGSIVVPKTAHSVSSTPATLSQTLPALPETIRYSAQSLGSKPRLKTSAQNMLSEQSPRILITVGTTQTAEGICTYFFPLLKILYRSRSSLPDRWVTPAHHPPPLSSFPKVTLCGNSWIGCWSLIHR